MKYILFLMFFVLVNSNVRAEDAELPTSGTCGTDCTWSYNESTKTIKISGNETGTGVMENYTYTYSGRYIISAPWAGYRDIAENIIIEGVGNIGNNAFIDFQNIKNVEMDDNVTYFGNDAFAQLTHLEKVTLSNNLVYIAASNFQEAGSWSEKGLESLVFPETVTSLQSLKAMHVGVLVIPANLASGKISATLFTDGYDSRRGQSRIGAMYCTEAQMEACSAALADGKVDIEPTRYEKTSDGIMVYDKQGRIVSKYTDVLALGNGNVTETYKYDSAGHLVGIFDGNGQRKWGKKIYTVEEAMKATAKGDRFHVYLTYK